jgi:hypothetical protein
MTVHAWRLPTAFDPLIAEAKQRMRRRRVLLVTGIVVVVALGSAAAGLGPSLGNGPPPGFGGLPADGGSSNQTLVLARYPGLSFRYPTAWGRHDRCAFESWGPPQPLTVLTTSYAASACASEADGTATRWPPRLPLGRDGVLAYLTVMPSTAEPRVSRLGVATRGSYCARIGGQRSVTAVVKGPVSQLVLGACLRGPDLEANEHGLGSLLASVRFRH